MGRKNRDDRDNFDEEEGLAHRVITMLLRLAQLACACIVMGILARFCYQITVAQVSANSRIVYTIVISGITIVFSVLFCAPFNILALSFPFDFVLFVCWLVAFSLLAAQDHHCGTEWFYNYWGYYWGRWWNEAPVGFAPRYDGCGYWKTVLAFSFIASMMHLLSFILGIYIFRTYVRVSESIESAKKHTEKLRKPSQAAHASGANGVQPINGATNGATVETNAAGLPKPPRTPTPPGDSTPVQPATQV